MLWVNRRMKIGEIVGLRLVRPFSERPDDLIETYGGYSAELWRRWWGNDLTGDLLVVALHEDHDAYLFAHLDAFFDRTELQQLPDPEDTETYDDAGPDDEIQNAQDAILIAAYQKGWNAIIYDGNNKHLSLRTSSRTANLRGIRAILRKIMQDTPVATLTLTANGHDYQLDDVALMRFVKFGRLTG